MDFLNIEQIETSTFSQKITGVKLKCVFLKSLLTKVWTLCWGEIQKIAGKFIKK